MIYGIWDFGINNWAHEEHGSNAGMLAFSDKEVAEHRAAEYFGFEVYDYAYQQGVCEVRPLEISKPIHFVPPSRMPAWASRLEILGAL